MLSLLFLSRGQHVPWCPHVSAIRKSIFLGDDVRHNGGAVAQGTWPLSKIGCWDWDQLPQPIGTTANMLAAAGKRQPMQNLLPQHGLADSLDHLSSIGTKITKYFYSRQITSKNLEIIWQLLHPQKHK